MTLTNEITINKVQNELKCYKKSTVSLKELYKIVSKFTKYSEADLYTIEYDLFYRIIKELIEHEIINTRGRKTNSRGLKELHLNYNNLVKAKKETLTEEDKLFLHNLNRNIDITSYFKNSEKFNEDKEKLKILSDFLNTVTDETSYISINERSYEVFGYEKELVNENGGLLKRTRVPLDALKCHKKYTSLQCHIFKNFYTKEDRVILIIENEDTYLSLLKISLNTNLGEYIDMLVYGGGNMISGNFKQHMFYSIRKSDQIYYFGDIDPEGLSIYQRLKNANTELNIKLCNELYKLAIEIGYKRGLNKINNENQHFPSSEDVDNLLSDLENSVAENFKHIIYNSKYIPQEAVNYNILLEKTKALKG